MLVLDITAGNRHIWKGSNPPPLPEDKQYTVIYLDIERDLKIPPDIIADNTKLPIRENVIDIHVYDPPYWYFGTSKFHGDPQETHGGWWGNFRNKTNLRRLITGASVEIRRTLRDNGLLMIKWCDAVVDFIEIEIILQGGLDSYLRGHELREVARSEWVSLSGRSNHITRWVTYQLSKDVNEKPSR